ncbi:MAG: hypothetical protein AMXMBFR7_01880 [Planctomycetota bacterium]
MNLDRIRQIAVLAKNLEESVSFYRDTLGCRFVAKFDPPGLAFLDLSGVRILLERSGPKATLYFGVDDIESAYAELTAKGVNFTHPPRMIHRDDQGLFGQAGQEEWMAFFEDPSGNTLALATQKPGPPKSS